MYRDYFCGSVCKPLIAGGLLGTIFSSALLLADDVATSEFVAKNSIPFSSNPNPAEVGRKISFYLNRETLDRIAPLLNLDQFPIDSHRIDATITAHREDHYEAKGDFYFKANDDLYNVELKVTFDASQFVPETPVVAAKYTFEGKRLTTADLQAMASLPSDYQTKVKIKGADQVTFEVWKQIGTSK